jgi:3-dehydroquinate dehydratase I
LADDRPKICAAITTGDIEALNALEPDVDLWEVRIDLIGRGWRKVAAQLHKPWIACNRRTEEGGKATKKEPARIKELLNALELGASIIDIELGTPGVADIAKEIKGRAQCLVSFHDFKGTPPPDRLKQIVINQMAAEADICKLVTTARRFQDNLDVLQVIADFPETKVVAFAMGKAGQVSRIFSPLAGGYFTYASLAPGKESANGQVTVQELRRIYRLLGDRK